MNQIKNQDLIYLGSLDAASYFTALVKEGYRGSHLSASQLEKLQYQLLQLLTEQFNRWTGGQSSSVPMETGQQIQQSVFYTLGYHLKSFPESELALEELRNNTLNHLFLEGKQRMENDRKEAQSLMLHIQENRFSTDVLAYNETLNEGLPMFFKSYDIDYGAHETPASIDYPLSGDKMNLTGIEYILGYLQKLQLEDKFCSTFSGEEIHRLLRGYDRQYKELLFNIFRLVLTNAAGCLLLGRIPDTLHDTLHISDYDKQYLHRELSPLTAEQLDKLLDRTVSLLCGETSGSDDAVADYAKTAMIELKSRLTYALEAKSLDNLFLSTKDDISKPVLLFEDMRKLDHGSFRKLADEIRDCRFISDKIALLQQQQPAMADLIDLLEGDCFFGEEYHDVFRSLEDIQLVLLIKKLPLDPAGSDYLEEEIRPEWQDSFHDYLEQMEPQRKSSIQAMAERVEII